jgi:voltage-gated potassium channel Kch
MKTIAKTLVAISILMISLSVSAGNNIPVAGQVHYKVQIHLPKDMPFRTEHVYVVMTDERNQPIGPAQLLTYGKLTYEFTENQAVIGTRKAMIIYSDGNTSRLFHSTPDVQNGKFIIGGTYIFNLYIVFEEPGGPGVE